MAFTLVNDVKAMNRLNVLAHKAGAKAAVALHEAGFNCVAHVANTGDIRPLQHLFDGLTPRAKTALSVWAVKHCPRVKFDSKAGSFGVKKSDEKTDFGILQEIGPMEFVQQKAPPVAKEFNLRAELEKLYARAIKHDVSGKPVTLIAQAIKAA